MARIPLSWLQLKREKFRFLVALAGVGFAVVLMLMQLGFRDSLFESAVQFHRALRYDIVLMSPKTTYIARSSSFSQRRLYQALATDGVESVAAVYASLASWRNPVNFERRAMYVLGIDAADGVFELPEVLAQLETLRKQDYVIYDETSRPEFGPIAEAVRRGETPETELNNRWIRVAGLFAVGTSFGINGSVVTSDMNFLRIFPERQRGLIDFGLIRLADGRDPAAMAKQLRQELAGDVLVLTEEEFVEREKDFWASTTPIGYVFTFGVIIGIFVGGIIVYQILFADVSDHFSEYATLKAMGYSNGYLSRVVLEQAVILGALGFIPGLALCLWLYSLASSATRLPLIMTPGRILAVLSLTIAMCAVSGLIALRKLRSVDPAEVF